VSVAANSSAESVYTHIVDSIDQQEMLFRILGPVELTGRRTSLPPKIRLLLFIFLVGANKVVSTNQIISQLWGDDPPRTVATTLQVYVSQLRKVLPAQPNGAARLSTRAPGYHFQLLPGESDATRFKLLYARAREKFKAGDYLLAERLLEEALGLWRGPAGADVLPGPMLSGVIVALEDARLAAHELRVECGLRLDRHEELVPELQLLTVEHPYSERVAGQLMIALTHSGRQADALFAYNRLRARLAEDLGVVPGVWVTDLRRRLLATHSSPISLA